MADLQLLRDAIRWARAEGWCRDEKLDRHVLRWVRGRADIDGNPAEYLHIEIAPGWPHMLETQSAHAMVESVKHGLDVLVALGVLPPRFSTAYAMAPIIRRHAVEAFAAELRDGLDQLERHGDARLISPGDVADLIARLVREAK